MGPYDLFSCLVTLCDSFEPFCEVISEKFAPNRVFVVTQGLIVVIQLSFEHITATNV